MPYIFPLFLHFFPRRAPRRGGQRGVLPPLRALQVLKVPQGPQVHMGGVHPGVRALRLLGQGGGEGPLQLPPGALGAQAAVMLMRFGVQYQ